MSCSAETVARSAARLGVELDERVPDVDPAPPRPCRPGATFSPRFAQLEFEQLVACGWRVRRPATTAEGLIACGEGLGACLGELVPEGARVWFDPALPADDGDLVLVEYSTDFLVRLFESTADAPADWRAAWLSENAPGGRFPALAAKVLRHGNGERYATCSQYGFRLERIGRVLGVARRIEVDGRPIQRPPPRILAHAAMLVGGLALGLTAAIVIL